MKGAHILFHIFAQDAVKLKIHCHIKIYTGTIIIVKKA